MSELIVIIIFFILNIILWIVFFIKLKKQYSPDVVLHEIKNEVEKLLIEINRVADQDITIIESRIKSLRNMIEEADKRTTLADSVENTKKREKKILKQLQPTSMDLFGNTEQSIEKEDNAAVTVDIDFSNYKVEVLNQKRNDEVTAMPVRDKVLKLHNEGFSVDLISEKLSMSEIEVQMIIDLYGM